MSLRRVVITGFGAVSPLGLTVGEMWNSLRAGKSGISGITSFDCPAFACKLAGQVPAYNILRFVPKTYRKAVKLMSKDIELAVIAANEAFNKSGFVTKAADPERVNIDPTRTAINLGAGYMICDLVEIGPAVAASLTDGKFDIRKWGSTGMEQLTPLWLLKYLPNMLACHISIIHDIQGPSNTITCAEASAQIAIGEAAQIIARGDSDVALAGGAEAKVSPLIMFRQCLFKRTVTRHSGPPESACRPFDAEAKGSVFGDGAGIIVLEDLEHARKRNANILAEIVGIGQSSGIGPEYEKLESDGAGVRIAIEEAIECAHIGPDDLDLLIPHGTGVPYDDLSEAKGIQAALGPAASKVPVWPTKSMITNTGAASGALDVIAAVCAIKNAFLPAAKNLDKRVAGCNLNIVKESRQSDIKYALCCSYTHGGQTAAVILKKYAE